MDFTFTRIGDKSFLAIGDSLGIGMDHSITHQGYTCSYKGELTPLELGCLRETFRQFIANGVIRVHPPVDREWVLDKLKGIVIPELSGEPWPGPEPETIFQHLDFGLCEEGKWKAEIETFVREFNACKRYTEGIQCPAGSRISHDDATKILGEYMKSIGWVSSKACIVDNKISFEVWEQL